MTSRARALGLLLLPLLLTGCATAHAATPAPTVTVTVTPTAAPVKAGDSAPWDLHAVCAAESEAQTLIVWREQQTKAGRLSSAQSAAVLQAIAVQYLEFDGRALPDAVQQDVTRLRDAAGDLEHPRIDLGSKTVESAQDRLHQACAQHGLTIGVLAQGG
ncbi:hypothetical protein [Amnibacterium kyonggiense]|uniref:Lipoprotein n=1 Tax=Amnibacterium kyonggiense TaxID=595671 RepID=A0A4R7FSP1_9MICO|nr:hypothetical protein [Amnibacterium kyonggiense]TDS80895.1 hypothetical protein CLV52_1466 [Amnibacterium kyonggiense]